MDRTSRLLDKLQQVEAMGEGARQQMRQENVSLAAREDELLEQVLMDIPPPVPVPSTFPRLLLRPPLPPPPPAGACASSRLGVQGPAQPQRALC